MDLPSERRIHIQQFALQIVEPGGQLSEPLTSFLHSGMCLYPLDLHEYAVVGKLINQVVVEDLVVV